VVRKASAVRVSGVTGGLASTVNGSYLPMDGEESGGRPVYKKGRDEVYIEYLAALGQWQVKPGANRGTDIAYMSSVEQREEAGVVEEVRCGWQVYNPTSKTWEQQAGAVVVRKCRPRTFYHATKLKAALSIQDQGFRVPAGPGGCLGPGIYCTTTEEGIRLSRLCARRRSL
jgi:hypothetical protein